MEWDVQSKKSEVKKDSSVSMPSTEGMPPLTDIKPKLVKRRSRTGSLTAHHCVPEPRDTPHRESSTAMMPPLTRIRKTPIAQGGSWDDNSVGHGSVAARMRRERNRAILRTQSSMTNPMYHSIDTNANVTSTLNLINTTSLSPLPSERYCDNNEWMKYLWENNSPPNYHSVATKSSSGSMCNIPISGHLSHQPQSHWDTLSIPEFHSTKSCDRSCRPTHHRHSYSAGYANTSHLHSSPTSGCASIASSDLDSADFMYFNINDDSSYFDGDSLFADSLGMMGEGDTAFSTNILSLLEEGSISCRTPFPASDWPDSISELDFDCSEGKTDDVTNCDALSDIGPSCSTPPQRRRMTKRQALPQNKADDAEPSDSDVQQSMTGTTSNETSESALEEETSETPSSSPTNDPGPQRNPMLDLNHLISEVTWSNFTKDEKEDYIKRLSFTITQSLSFEEQMDIFRTMVPAMNNTKPQNFHVTVEDVDYSKLVEALEEKKQSCEDWYVVKPNESQKNGFMKLKKQKMGAKPLKLGNISHYDDSQCCSHVKKHCYKMEALDCPLVHHTDPSLSKVRTAIRYHLDEMAVQSKTRSDSRQETSSTKSADPKHMTSCSDASCQGCSTSLRRSNSDGNIPKSVASEAQKEYRRQQRQARRWAKLLKTRQRKENRQLKKEHRSGLFVNEKKVKLKANFEEIDIDIN